MPKKRYTGLDFETSIGDSGECVLEYVALSNKEYEEVYDLHTEEELMRFVLTIVTSGEVYVVYNASFDIEIIMNLLLQVGYYFDDTHKGGTMDLLSGTKIYRLDVYTRYHNKLIKSSFIDLGNLIVGSNLEEIAENYTPYHKGSYELSKENKQDFEEYNLLDARITRVAYENITAELGMETITIGSASFNLMLDTAYPDKTDAQQKKLFKANYGDLTIDDDKYLRQFYRGGLGWCSVKGRWEGRVNSWDKKSAYPYECIGKDLPTFNGRVKFSGYAEPTPNYPFAFIEMEVTGVVKDNHCPVLPSRSPYGDSNVYIYQHKIVHIIQIYGEKSEYDYFMENVEIKEIEYISTTLMKKATENPLQKYMKKYYNIKEKSSGVKKDVAKRLINSLTGKLGTNPQKERITYKLVDGVLKRDLDEDTECDTYATHVVAVITSRTRCSLYEIDAKLRDKCKFRLYATDSCKHSTEVEIIQQAYGIGQWNEEYHDVAFIYVGLKAYMFDPYNEQGQKKVMCAGISKNYKEKIEPDQFYSGNYVPSLISARSKGGRIIIEGMRRIATTQEKPRTIEELEKWQENTNKHNSQTKNKTQSTNLKKKN